MSSGATDGVPPLGDAALTPLRRLAFTVLPPSTSRRRRARLADTLARRALSGTAGHAAARTAVVRDALHAGPGRLGLPIPRLARATGSGTDCTLAAMVPATRAAFALLHLEHLSAVQAAAVLAAAGVRDPQTAVTLAERTPLEPAAIRALVVPVPAGPDRSHLVAAGVGVLVLVVSAPVVAVTALGSDDAPTPVSTVVPDDAERAAAVQAAETALREARAREASQTAAAEADRSLTRILRRLDAALDKPGTRKETKRLKALRSAVKAERERLTR